MFCPQCSQEQISEEVRFCKGCGFPLVDIAEALKNNGLVNRSVIPAAQNLKKDVIKGLSVMTLSGIFFILSLILGTPEPSFAVQFNMLVGILCYVLGLVWIGYSFWGKSSENLYENETARSLNFGKIQNLPETDRNVTRRLNEPDFSQIANTVTTPASNLKTNDLTKDPLSVTESTTKLLKKDL